MSPRAKRRPQLPDEVAAYVRELIISGKVKAGEFLRMEPIAEAVGVSNTPVREGLLALRSEGFIELVPRRGFVVSSFTPQDVHDVFWAQAQLAGELAARAAQTADDALIARLERLLDEQDESADSAEVADVGHAFHREINLSAGSRRLALMLGTLVSQLPWTFYADLESEPATTADHRNLVEALRSHDAPLARRLMEEHMLARAERLRQRLTRQGFWNGTGTSA